MANYSLVINSRFRPFEYQELLAPVLMATQAHQALEEAYGDLDTEAAVWDRRTEGSKKAHDLYTNFSKDLANAAETLSKYGLNPQSRRTMLNMRSRYASDITPIAEAWTKRQADIKAQQEALVRDPEHFFNRMANNISLDEYMDNPTLDVLSENHSGALLAQQVSQAASNLKQTLMKKGNLTKLGLPYQYERMLQYGASADEVFAAMSKDPKALPILTNLVEDVMDASGIRKWSSMNGDWANNDTYKRAEAAAMRGLYSAIGTSKIDNFTDSFSMQDAINARQHARAVAAQREAEERARMKMYDVSPTNYYSKTEIAAANELTVKELDKWKKLGYFNSKGQLTKRGFNALQYKPAKSGGVRFDRFGREIPTRVKGGSGDFEFYNWASKHGVTNPSDKYSANILNNYYQNTRSAIASGKLATGAANFQVYRQRLYNESDRKVMVDNITNVLGDKGKIYRAGRVSNNTISESKNDAITGKKFKEITKDNPILYVVNSPTTGKYGQQLIELANGDKYILPTSILGNDAQAIISDANTRVRNAGSRGEVAANLNRANAALASMYTVTTGAEIKPNDGTSIIELE